MSERSFAAAIAAIAALGLAVVVSAIMCHGPAPTPVPSGLATRLENHAIATAVDTSEIHRLRVQAARADSDRARASRVAIALDKTAQIEHARADSLAAIAAAATSAIDSATGWHAAYEARSAEVDTLKRELAYKDTALVDARLQIAAVDSAFQRSQRRAARADSVIAAAVAVVKASDPPCRFAHFFSCPSRTEAAVGSAVLGAIGVGVLESRIGRRR